MWICAAGYFGWSFTISEFPSYFFTFPFCNLSHSDFQSNFIWNARYFYFLFSFKAHCTKMTRLRKCVSTVSLHLRWSMFDVVESMQSDHWYGWDVIEIGSHCDINEAKCVSQPCQKWGSFCYDCNGFKIIVLLCYQTVSLCDLCHTHSCYLAI